MKKIILISALMLTGVSAHAQEEVLVTDDLMLTPQFIVAIIAGVILALAFQVILTAISIAAGITAIGDIKEKYVKAQLPAEDNSGSEDTYNQQYDIETPTGVKVTSAFGIWCVITTSLALFGATVLAINLSVISVPITSITMALVIWGLFFLILFYLEARLVNTVLGGLINTATQGLRSAAGSMKDLFTTSDEKKTEKVISSTIEKIRSEFEDIDISQFSEPFRALADKVDKKVPDYKQLKKDMEEIVRKSQNNNSQGKYMAMQQVLTKAIETYSEDGNEAAGPKGKIEQLKTLLNELKSEYRNSDSKEESVKNILEKFTDMDRREIEENIEKIKNVLRQSKPEIFEKNGIKQTIQEILKDPKTLVTLTNNKLNQLNRESIIETLNKNTNLDESQLNTYADRVEETVKSIVEKFNSNNESSLQRQMEARVADFFNSTQRSELNYDALKADLKRILDNPNDSLDVIKKRVSKFDEKTVRAILTKNRYIDDENIDNVLSKVNEVKSEILDKVNTIQTKTREQVEMIKRKAVIQAEHTRRTAASAAWWLVITAIISGGAAMVGAVVA